MKEKIVSRIITIKRWVLSHKVVTWAFSMIVSALVGWLVSWILPSQPVIASNVPQKELTCILNYSFNLIQKRTSDNKLQITYDGKVVDDPHVFSISIQNTGSLAISNEDFKQEFVIWFHDCGAILSAQVSKSSSQHVTDEILLNSRIDGEKLFISDFFLNPDESFSISVITDKASSGITYDARISDISSLTLRNSPRETRDSVRNVMIAAPIILVVALGIFAIVEYLSYKRFKKRIHMEFMNDTTNISK